MQKFALIGKNISKSLSPALFKAAYPGFDACYSLLESDNAKEAFDMFIKGGYKGANITSPFKEEFMFFCDKHDQISERCGVTNLILWQDGALKSYNTDYYGVRDPLLSNKIPKGNAVVVGAGGAAKAAVLALKDSGMNVTVVNRTGSKASELAQKSGVKFALQENLAELLTNSNLLVYTIDVAIDEILDANLNKLTVLEANYKNPVFSDKDIARYICGREWLVAQAIPSFKLFTGLNPDITAMKLVAENC
jgi:shikimate dehydrogenase